MPGGGEIEVRLLDGEGAAGFEVTDQGQGIARDDLDRVFDPFFTTKDTGTGLGLATVHRIVQDHGGRVEIASALGNATRVRASLPAVQAAAAAGWGCQNDGCGGARLFRDSLPLSAPPPRGAVAAG